VLAGRSRSTTLFAAFAALLLSASLLAGAHLYNHGTRHEDCGIYIDPHSHDVADGHVHWHHLEPAAASHSHNGTLYPAGHTHADTFHDPCDQAGMARPEFVGVGPIPEISVTAAAVAAKSPLVTPAILDGEAFLMGVPSLVERDDLIVRGDADLAAMGFPGSGTPADPYIIEGYKIRNVLLIRDTSACIVVRDNVVHSQAVLGPLADITEVVDRKVLLDEAKKALEELEAQVPGWDAAKTQWDLDLGPVLDEYEAQQAKADAVEAEAKEYAAKAAAMAGKEKEYEEAEAKHLAKIDAQKQAVQDAEAALESAVEDYEDEAEAFQDFLDQHTASDPPDDDYKGDKGDAGKLKTSFGDYLGTFGDYVDGAADADASEAYQAAYDSHAAALDAAVTSYEGALQAADDAASGLAVAVLAYLAHDKARDAFEKAYDAFKTELTGFQKKHDAVLDDLQAFVDQHAGTFDDFDAWSADHQAFLDLVAEAEKAVDELEALVEEGLYEYAGIPFDELTELADVLVAEAFDELDVGGAGRMILDWNGQCVHAYHNVVEDLRVNRNNPRTGYVTGGLIEDNRFYTIGQIRHYDGEFRENEVGDRAILYAMVPGDPRHGEAPPSERAINNDGANQGWFHHNLVYGSVDLDFHGHHHGPGFTSRESHYHGGDFDDAYMVNGTSGKPVLGPDGHPLAHHDHHKRWTSVRFEDNTVIDPLGYGVRYEDQNHAGDDRSANSEDMDHLDHPHFHRTWVQIERNTIVGSLWVDVFNADGIEVWDDDWSEVERDTVGRVVDAVLHLGADIKDTHMMRNDGWLDIRNNVVYLVDKESGTRGGHYGWSAYQVNDAKEMDLLAFLDNQAFVVPHGADPGFTDAALLVDYLEDADLRAPSTTQGDLGAWGPHRADHPEWVGILMRHVKDAGIDVCGNSVLGFDTALMATKTIRPDAVFTLCGTNDWGGAPVQIVATPYPPTVAGIMEPVRNVTDATPVKYVVAPVLDEVDAVGAPAKPVVDDAVDTATGLLP